ncbi:MAG: hypothetical protein ACRC5H_05645 [Treponemataceae bacterium]
MNKEKITKIERYKKLCSLIIYGGQTKVMLRERLNISVHTINRDIRDLNNLGADIHTDKETKILSLRGKNPNAILKLEKEEINFLAFMYQSSLYGDPQLYSMQSSTTFFQTLGSFLCDDDRAKYEKRCQSVTSVINMIDRVEGEIIEQFIVAVENEKKIKIAYEVEADAKKTKEELVLYPLAVIMHYGKPLFFCMTDDSSLLLLPLKKCKFLCTYKEMTLQKDYDSYTVLQEQSNTLKIVGVQRGMLKDKQSVKPPILYHFSYAGDNYTLEDTQEIKTGAE